jgi:4-hydroxy-3-methylbut-2-enyl diphosphate reductase
MKILLANPRGFCAGVDRAVQIVEKALERFGRPIYVRHEIVHNKFVVDRLKEMGAVFVEEVEEAPENCTIIFSAHGVADEVYEKSARLNQRVIDASCPLVKKVHFSAKNYYKKGSQTILIGHAGHAEVIGTMGQLPVGAMYLVGSVDDVEALNIPDHTDLAYVTQTTLSVAETRSIIDALNKKFPAIKGPERGDLCYATTNRQEAVRDLSNHIELLLIVGASNSSNSNRLRELGVELGVPSYLISGASDLKIEWFNSIQNVGISSGASAPEVLVQDVVQWIKDKFEVSSVENLTTMKENVRFSLPMALLD